MSATQQLGLDGKSLGCLGRCIVGCPVFYGYIIAAIGTIGMIATGPGQTPVIGTTITQIAAELDIDRTRVSSLYLMATVGSACTLPFMGKLLDILGPPPMFALAVAGLGLTCLAFGTFTKGSITLGCAFYCLRIFGQGLLMLVSQNAVNLWFSSMRGRVMGVCSFFNSLCLTGLFSSFVKEEVVVIGWRRTYTNLGYMELCTVLPLGIALLRQKPEAYGLLPDGERVSAQVLTPSAVDGLEEQQEIVWDDPDEEEAPLKDLTDVNLDVDSDCGEPISSNDLRAVVPGPARIGRSSDNAAASKGKQSAITAEIVDFTFGQAVRTLAFWSMSLGAFTIAALGTALFFHLDDIFSGPGYNDHLKRIYLSSAAAAAVTTLITGYLIDKSPAKYIMVGALVANTTCLLTSAAVVRWHADARSFFVIGMFSGISSGSFNSCLCTAYANWFGRTHNGKIQGLATSMVVLGSAVGPASVSLGHDFFGEYYDVLLVAAAWPVLCIVLVLCTKEPRKI